MGERVASQSARRPIYRVAALRRGRRGAWSSTVPGLGVGWKTPSSVHATTLAPQGRRGAAKFGHDQLAPAVAGSGPSLDATCPLRAGAAANGKTGFPQPIQPSRAALSSLPRRRILMRPAPT